MSLLYSGMDADVKTRRRYNSEGRRRQAAVKRREMVIHARELFLERGYKATTMEAIAAGVGVAVETVYAAFGNKTGLLSRVIEVSIVGDEAAIPLLQRDWLGEVRAEPDPRKRLRRLAALTTSILSRVGPIHALVRGASDSDPDLAALKLGEDEKRYRAQLEFVRLLEDALRPGLTLEAARDIYWTIASPEVHHLLTRDRGWSSAAYQEWLGSVLEASLLG